MNKILQIIPILCVLLIQGCKNDNDYVYPAVKLEFVTLGTGTGGELSQLVTDFGEVYLVNNDKTNTRLEANKFYRAVCNYQPLSKPSANEYGTTDIYALTGAYCGMTIPAVNMSGKIKTDPVTVHKIWKRGNFINMELTMLAKDQQHDFAYIEEGFETGTKNVVVKLHHDSHGDDPAYTKTAYMSLQLSEFRAMDADSVVMRFNTDNGWDIYKFSVIPENN